MPVDHIIRSQINLGERTAPVIARVNRRAKQLILKVDPVAGEIVVTAPSKRSLKEAIRFAQDRADWIETQLDERLRAKPFSQNLLFPYRGKTHEIIREGGPRAPVRLLDGAPPKLLVGGEEVHLNRRLTDWLKRQARRALTEKVDLYCSVISRKRRALRIRDTRTQWGSCSSDGIISFSWRLILAPPEILDYVAAHECVHLLHMDHSRGFWRDLARLGVDARAAGNWFNKNGPGLFAYGACT